MKPYQEFESYYSSNGVKYDLNIIWKAVYKDPIKEIEVSKLKWILKYSDTKDKQRVKNADLSTPLLVIEQNRRPVVVDGAHRLAKAVASNVLFLPYWAVSKAVLDSSKVNEKVLRTLNSFSDWK